jgi:hypothetical protein
MTVHNNTIADYELSLNLMFKMNSIIYHIQQIFYKFRHFQSPLPNYA